MTSCRRFRQIVAVLLVLGPLCVLAGPQGHRSRVQTKTRVIDIENVFSPSGWMGDGAHPTARLIRFSGCHTENPRSGPYCMRIRYKFGTTRWGGLYWLNRPRNWGKSPGEDWSALNVTYLTFWARGSKGGEVVEFKAGGIDSAGKPHRDSFEKSLGRVRLGPEWKQYRIDLRRETLSSVIGGFCWVAADDFNSQPEITFFLDDIQVETRNSETPSLSLSVVVVNVQDTFSPSGWMGELEAGGRSAVTFDASHAGNPHTKPECVRVSYRFRSPTGWGGIYWLNKADNWGHKTGAPLAEEKEPITGLVFWARGEVGGEVVEFGSGGIAAVDRDSRPLKHKDSFYAPIGRVVLKQKWTKYQIDLRGRNLSSVIGGFYWAASAQFNKHPKITFYIDDMAFMRSCGGPGPSGVSN